MSRLTDLYGYGSAVDLRTATRDHFGCRKRPQVAEILSALIVLLPEFVQLIGAAGVPYWNDPRDVVERIAQLVVGGKKFSTRPFLNEIVSGSIDADKLDYMPRDCYMAGLPMPVDVERLLEKVQSVRIPANQLPDDYARVHGLAPDDGVQVLAVESSGTQAFDELLLSRLFLYQKLYYHQKVRAMEGMIENALDLLVAAHPSFKQLSTFLSLSDAGFLNGEWPSAAITHQSAYKAARGLVDGVNRRRAFVRAFAFGPELIEKPQSTDEKAVRDAWWRLKPLVSRDRSAPAIAFRQSVAAKAKLYLETAGQVALANELAEHQLVIDLPEVQGIAEKTRFYVGDEEFGVQPYSKLFRAERWAEAYEYQKSIGYVYCPAEYGHAVHLAFRDLVREEAGIEFDQRAWKMTKLQPERLKDLADLISARGTGIPEIAIPAERRERRRYLETAAPKLEVLNAYGQVLGDLVVRFQTFRSHTGIPVDEGRTREWLFQFSRDDLPFAIRVLQHVRYWERRALADAFAMAIKQFIPAEVEHQALPLGGPMTSAHHLNYLWPDVRSLVRIEGVRVLDGPSGVHPGLPLILYDDNVGSSGQGRTVLQQWFGRPQNEWILEEHHVAPLEPEVLAKMRLCSLTFLFATGRREGLRDLVRTAKELFGHDRVEGHIMEPRDFSCFSDAAGLFRNPNEAERARRAFQDAGRRALADKVGDWGEAKIVDRLLGYGNAGGLTVFYYNVPTTTLTALWKDCVTNNDSLWKALFPRRPHT